MCVAIFICYITSINFLLFSQNITKVFMMLHTVNSNNIENVYYIIYQEKSIAKIDRDIWEFRGATRFDLR